MIKTVIVNGTFDILHRGHLTLLNHAKSLGDYLIVCIDTDERVKQLKGEDRPIHNQEDRKFFLSNLKSVDEVMFFSSDKELESIIKETKPDIMVKGSDYRNKHIVGGHLIREIVFFDILNEYSTTKTIQRITSR